MLPVIMMSDNMRVNLIAFLLVLSFVFSACSNKSNPPIASDKMRDLLFDLQTAEAYSNGKFEGDSLGQKANIKNPDTLAYYYAMVFKRHNISQVDFEQALDWYLRHPDELTAVYNKVIDTASHFKTKFGKKDLTLPDSLQLQTDTAGIDTLMDVRMRKRDKVLDSLKPDPAGDRPVVPEREIPFKEEEEGAKKEIRKNNKSMKEMLDKVKKEN